MRLSDIEGVSPISADADLPRFMERTKWIVDLHEYRRTPDVYDNLPLPEWILANGRVRVLSPLLQLDRVVGFVALYDPPPPFVLTYEDRDLLKTVGRHVATHLAQHEADRRLAESAQFEAYNRLTAFLMHDLKNSVAQLKLIVANAARHKRNPEFIDDAIDTIANTVERMTRLIEQLTAPTAASKLSQVDLLQLVRDAIGRCAGRQPAPVLEPSESALVRADPERLIAIIEHLISNAQDASGETDCVRLQVTRSEEQVQLAVVTDTGRGMDQEFIRERLFRPFDSTKGSKGMGIGAYQVREYVQMLGGHVEVQSKPGLGTRFPIRLPRFQQASSRLDAGHKSEQAIS